MTMLNNQNITSPMLNREDAAKYLGISSSTLANWACTRKFNIPYIRLGKAVRYRKSDLDAFIESNAVT